VVFPGDLGFSIAIHIQIHHHFSSFFLSGSCGPPTVANGPLSAKSSPLAQTSGYATGYDDVYPYVPGRYSRIAP